MNAPKVLRVGVHWDEFFRVLPSMYGLDFSILQWTVIILVVISMVPLTILMIFVVTAEVAAIGMRLKNFKIRNAERLKHLPLEKNFLLREFFEISFISSTWKVFEGSISAFLGVGGAAFLVAYPLKWSWNYIIPRVLGFPSIGAWEAFCLCLVMGILTKGASLLRTDK